MEKANRDITMGEISYFCSVIIAIVVALEDDGIRKDFIGGWSFKWSAMIVMMFGIVGLLLLGKIRKMVIEKKRTFEKTKNHSQKTRISHSTVFACCIAPIGEEIIFRIILLGTLVDYIGTLWAIIITSLLFAVLHLKSRLIWKAFGVSVMLSLVTVITGTIIVAITMHMLLNYSSVCKRDGCMQ